jgi:hypothetical protein
MTAACGEQLLRTVIKSTLVSDPRPSQRRTNCWLAIGVGGCLLADEADDVAEHDVDVDDM